MRLRIVWRNLTGKPLQSLVTVAILAVAVSLTVTLLLLADGIHQGLTRATEPFDLIVGAKGSPIQLVLNTVLLQDRPIGNIPETLVAELQKQPGVAMVIPLGFGDNYRGYRIVGTSGAIFHHRRQPAAPPWLRLAAGKPFAAPFEAVVGAKTARELGLKPGDSFRSVHGLTLQEQGGERHEHPYRVVGVLKPVGGPYDQAILVPLEGIWEVHEDHSLPALHGQTHDHGVTAILVKPKGYADAMRLYQQYQTETRAQLIFPAQVIVQFFAIMGQGEQVLRIIAYAMIAMTLLTVALVIYWSALNRRREQAILRAVGARSGDIFRMIVAEGVGLVAVGGLAGLIVGHLGFGVLAGALQRQTALTIGLAASWQELYLILGTFGFGILASAIPAAALYRVDLVEYF